jgi:hypothetical protein
MLGAELVLVLSHIVECAQCRCSLSLCLTSPRDALTALGTSVLALVGIISVVYVIVQFGDFRRESKIKHLNDLASQFENLPMADYRKKLGAARPPNGFLQSLKLNSPPAEIHDVLNFFEHMGHLLAGRYLDFDGVVVEFHYWVLRLWIDTKDLIAKEQAEYAIYYVYFQEMARRMLEYKRSGTGKLPVPTQDDLADFYFEESDLKPGSPIPRRRRKRSSGSPTFTPP